MNFWQEINKKKTDIDQALQKTNPRNLRQKLNDFTQTYTQTALWTTTLLTLTWGVISSYNKTALLAIPLSTLALIEAKTT